MSRAELVEIELVAVEQVGLTGDRVGLEELIDVELEGPGEPREAAGALAPPGGRDRAPHDNALRDALEIQDDRHRVGDLGGGTGEVLDRLGQADRPSRPGMAEQIGDVNAKAGHSGGLERCGIPGYQRGLDPAERPKDGSLRL